MDYMADRTCTSTVFMLSSYFTGYCMDTASTSYSPGSRVLIESTISLMVSSRLLPPAAADRGYPSNNSKEVWGRGGGGDA